MTGDIFPWAATVHSIVDSLRIPRICGDLIYIASDYGGAHAPSSYETITVVYADFDASALWELHRRSIRHRFLLDGRRMAFKSLNDGNRRRALIPFLSAANHLSGVSVTLAIRKSIKNICRADILLSAGHEALGIDASRNRPAPWPCRRHRAG